MRRGAYHSIVKCKSDTVLFRKVTVYNVSSQLVGITESGEDHPCVILNVITVSDTDKSVGRKVGQFLGVAQYCTAFV